MIKAHNKSLSISNLVESSLDESLEFSNQNELFSSSLGGGLILLIEDTAEFGGVIEEDLVSLELVGSSLSDGGVGGD